MKRVLAICLLFVAAVFLAPADSSDAGPISRNNPYRSFNISGVNYGSTQWEIKHRKSGSSNKSWSAPRRGVRLRWR
jgi:hypothetical protein